LRTAVCTLLTQTDQDGVKILSVSRRDDTDAYGLPGGKVEPNETLENAAKRELLEETGVEAISLRPIFTCLCVGDVDYLTTTFIVDRFKGTPSNKGQGDVRWATPEELIDGPFGEYNVKLFSVAGISA
jgi:8-oxo-dGTP pyrophosphatase MutT (NUDIX family)